MIKIKVINGIEAKGMFGFDLIVWFMIAFVIGYIPVVIATILNINSKLIPFYLPLCIWLAYCFYNLRIEVGKSFNSIGQRRLKIPHTTKRR